MSWIPKKGTCIICRKEIMLMSAIQKYCPDCARKMRNISSAEGLERERARLIAISRGTDPDRYRGLHTECRYKKSCMYGGQQFCEYMTVTGHSRLLAGYPIKDGKCGAYKRGKKPRTNGLNYRSTSPVLRPGKLNEV